MTLTGIISLLPRLLGQYLRWLGARRAFYDLQAMPESLLQDIGIHRSSIPYVVGHGRNEILILNDRADDAAADPQAAMGAASHDGQQPLDWAAWPTLLVRSSNSS